MLSKLVGAAIIASALSIGAVDAFYACRDWSNMGPLPPGESLATFRVPMLDGGVLEFSHLHGRVSVVTFWATWCPGCRSELNELDELYEELREQLGPGQGDVQFLAVNLEGGGYTLAQQRRIARGYARKRGLQLPVALDGGAMAKLLRVDVIPHTVVLDRDGVIRYVHQGKVSKASIREEIDALLARD